jgi:hypothetical protein
MFFKGFDKPTNEDDMWKNTCRALGFHPAHKVKSSFEYLFFLGGFHPAHKRVVDPKKNMEKGMG